MAWLYRGDHPIKNGGGVREKIVRSVLRGRNNRKVGAPEPSTKDEGRTPLQTWKTRLDIVQSLATIAVLLLGAWWFLRQEQSVEKLNPVIQVESRQVAGASLLAVQVTLTNVGLVPVDVHFLHLRVSKVSPQDPEIQTLIQAHLASRTHQLDSGEFKWPVMVESRRATSIVLKPGESDISYFELFVPSDTKTVEVTLNAAHEQTSDYSWQRAVLYDTNSTPREKNETKSH
jgi:hypothetical protein